MSEYQVALENSMAPGTDLERVTKELQNAFWPAKLIDPSANYCAAFDASKWGIGPIQEANPIIKNDGSITPTKGGGNDIGAERKLAGNSPKAKPVKNVQQPSKRKPTGSVDVASINKVTRQVKHEPVLPTYGEELEEFRRQADQIITEKTLSTRGKGRLHQVETVSVEKMKKDLLRSINDSMTPSWRGSELQKSLDSSNRQTYGKPRVPTTRRKRPQSAHPVRRTGKLRPASARIARTKVKPETHTGEWGVAASPRVQSAKQERTDFNTDVDEPSQRSPDTCEMADDLPAQPDRATQRKQQCSELTQWKPRSTKESKLTGDGAGNGEDSTGTMKQRLKPRGDLLETGLPLSIVNSINEDLRGKLLNCLDKGDYKTVYLEYTSSLAGSCQKQLEQLPTPAQPSPQDGERGVEGNGKHLHSSEIAKQLHELRQEYEKATRTPIKYKSS